MKNISLNIDKALGTVTKEQVYAQAAKAHECNVTLQNGNGAGNDFLGWLHLPSSITDAELTDIENTANVLRSKCEVVVAIGDRKSTRLNSSHMPKSRMPSSA